MYIYSLVSVFCFRHFSVKQRKLEMYIILCRYYYHILSRVLKIKINLVKLTFRTAISSHQVMGMSLKKVCVMQNITRWIWFFSCIWLAENKRKWAVISKSYTMACPPVRGDNPRALASRLSYVQVDKYGITILCHLHQCRPCTSWDISC